MSARLKVEFSNYGLEEYRMFLRAKAVPEFEVVLDDDGIASGISVPARFGHLLGMTDEGDVTDGEFVELPEFLFEDQKQIVMTALEAERFACWSDCGLGKTLIELEFARQVIEATGGRVLIITLAEVVNEIVREAAKFYGEKLPIRILQSREEMRAWCAGESKASAYEVQRYEVGRFDLINWEVRAIVKIGGDGSEFPISVSKHAGNEAAARRRYEEMCSQAPGETASIAITNYEKMNPESGPDGQSGQIVNEMRSLAGLILDESSRLKTGGGKQKWALIKSSKGIRYKLSCTATPAPNEVMEFASQAAFLERIRGEGEVVWTYFTRDPVTQEWTVKAHARPHFFRWMASWSIYLRDPAAYGWRRVGADGHALPRVPEPEILEHRIEATEEQRALAFQVESEESAKATKRKGVDLFAAKSLGMVGRNVLNQIAKGFRYTSTATGRRGHRMIESMKPDFIAELVKRDVAAGLQVLVWCVFVEEVNQIVRALTRAGVHAEALTGDHSKKERACVLDGYRANEVPVLVSEASLLGFGLNFQFVGSMVFSGLTDSFEMFYQAVRRAFRFGQTRRLRVHLPYIPECEEAILRNVLRKASQFEALIAEQEQAYVIARAELEARSAA